MRKTQTTVRLLMTALALSFLPAGVPAMAEAKMKLPIDPLGLNGKGTIADHINPETLIKRIIAVAQPDLLYSIALAKAANTNPSNVRMACWTAIYNLNAQASGANLKDDKGNALTAPDAGKDIFTKAEQIAEGIDSLSPTGPLFTSCAGAAALANQNVLAFINALVAAVAFAPKVPIP